jgi:hypothetical protein
MPFGVTATATGTNPPMPIARAAVPVEASIGVMLEEPKFAT